MTPRAPAWGRGCGWDRTGGRLYFRVKMRVQSGAVMRAWCPWEVQAQCAPQLVENMGLDPGVQLRAHRECGSHGAGCRDAGRAWQVRREPRGRLRMRRLGRQWGQERGQQATVAKGLHNMRMEQCIVSLAPRGLLVIFKV